MKQWWLASAALACAGMWAAPAAAQEAGGDVPGLIVSLKSEDTATRAASARILGELGAPAREAVPALIEALADADKDVRRNAIKSLGQMGSASADAVPTIAKALGEASWEMRRTAVTALGAIGDPRAEDALKKARNDPNDRVRAAAKRALKQLKQARK
jgi:HEAT repeat protein